MSLLLWLTFLLGVVYSFGWETTTATTISSSTVRSSLLVERQYTLKKSEIPSLRFSPLTGRACAFLRLNNPKFNAKISRSTRVWLLPTDFQNSDDYTSDGRIWPVGRNESKCTTTRDFGVLYLLFRILYGSHSCPLLTVFYDHNISCFRQIFIFIVQYGRARSYFALRIHLIIFYSVFCTVKCFTLCHFWSSCTHLLRLVFWLYLIAPITFLLSPLEDRLDYR